MPQAETAVQWFFNLFRSLRHARAPVQTIVVGIGNPGPEYSATRHNVGFDVADVLAGGLKDAQRMNACRADIVTGRLAGGHYIACAKARTYVNRTGFAASALLKYFMLDPERCMVVVDDFNLPLGTVRIRKQGSDGGHNGLKSIIDAIGNKFPRVRVGIGPVPGGMSTIDFVLGPFENDQEEKKKQAIHRAAQAVISFCDSGVETAMNQFN